MKKKIVSMLMVTALVASLTAGCGSSAGDGEKADAKKEKKDVSELIIGEMEYSVVEDGGWAQSSMKVL